jgi:two-component system chemotaxis response regulator CheB
MNRPVPAAPAENIPRHIETELRIAGEDDARASGVMAWGKPSAFACPECHGVLLQRLEGAHVRYRCHTGHAYTLESLLAEYLEKTEESLWNAVRALDETIMVFSRMAEQAEASGDSSATARIRAHAAAAEARSQALRKILLSRQTIGEAPRA